MSQERTALIVEGGALRGAFVVGLLRVLHEYGGADVFDAVIAVSSGVFAATYFSAGQVDEMENTWRELVHGRQLVDYRNILRMRPVLKLDYLIHLFKTSVFLDLDKVNAAKPRITYVITNFDTGLPEYVDAKTPDIFDLMRASSALPLIYPVPVTVNGVRYFDGGYGDPIPVQYAIDRGYTKLLVLLTRPPTYKSSRSARIMARVGLRKSPKALEALERRGEVYQQAMRVIETPPPGVLIHTLRPRQGEILHLERSQEAIIATIEHGKEVAEDYMRKFGGILAS